MVLFLSVGSIYTAFSEREIYFQKTEEGLQRSQPNPPDWIPQKQQTSEFRFEVSGIPNSGDFSNDGEVNALKIINKKTGKIQLISNIEAALYDSLDDVIQVQDVNFDGHPDIWMYAHSGGAGPNDGNNYYLFNPKTKKFEYNQQLSDLTQVSIDSETKTIESAFRDGCCHHGGATYTFKENQLDTLSIWDQQFGYSGIFAENYSKEKIDGKWKDSLFYSMIPVHKVIIRDRPSEKAKIIVMVKADWSSLRVIKENPLWFYIKRSEANNLDKGWVKKNDIFPKQKILYSTETNKYKFYAVSPDSSQVMALEIFDKRKKQVRQIIPLYHNMGFKDDLKIEEKNNQTVFTFNFESVDKPLRFFLNHQGNLELLEEDK